MSLYQIIIVVHQCTALLAMKGLMIQEDMTIDEAIKVMEEGQRAPDRVAPMLPPKVLSEFGTQK